MSPFVLFAIGCVLLIVGMVCRSVAVSLRRDDARHNAAESVDAATGHHLHTDALITTEHDGYIGSER